MSIHIEVVNGTYEVIPTPYEDPKADLVIHDYDEGPLAPLADRLVDDDNQPYIRYLYKLTQL